MRQKRIKIQNKNKPDEVEASDGELWGKGESSDEGGKGESSKKEGEGGNDWGQVEWGKYKAEGFVSSEFPGHISFS